MRLKIFKKLFFTTSAVLLVTLTFVFVLLSLAVSDAVAKDKYEILDRVCDTVSSQVSETESILSDAQEVMVSLSEVNQIDLFIADSFGKIIACGCDEFSQNGNCLHTNSIIKKDFLKEITADGTMKLSSIGGMYEKLNYVVAKKMSTTTELYTIAVSKVMSANELIKTMLGMYAVSALLPLMFMFVAEYSLVYRFTRPLRYMSIAAKSIAQGDFSKRVPVMSNDEIGELSALFNRMTESLSKSEKTGKSFIANISHELKTPMTTISGFIDGIIDGTIDESQHQYYLQIVSDEVKRLARLVQSMLSLTNLESENFSLKQTEFRPADTIVNVVVSMEQGISSKNINIVGLDELSQTVVTGDIDLIYQIFYNLTDNAVKYTPFGGDIKFDLHRIDNMLEFKIKNSGEGVPQKDLPHIFERFYKIDKSRSANKDSLGLGLYICKTIAELHKGSIKVESDSETYTEFTVALPIQQ